MEQEKNLKGLSKLSLIDLSKIKATKTTDFLLPLLGFTKKFYEPYLVNAYLGDYDLNGYEEKRIYLVLSNHDMSTKHMRIEDGLKNMLEFVDFYDILDGQMSVFIMKVPETFEEDYSKFLLGKYSEFSEEAKIAVLKGRSEKSSMPLIFRKDSKLKEYWEEKTGSIIPDGLEVWPVINIDNELLYKEKFILKTD